MDKHRKALELAGHAGCILLKNGAEIFRVQETMTRILCAYGVTDNNVYVFKRLFATEGEGTEHALSLVRHVPLGGVNLSRIDAVNAISREICEGRWTTDEAEALLTRRRNAHTRKSRSRMCSPVRSARQASAICSAVHCWTAPRPFPSACCCKSICLPPKSAAPASCRISGAAGW